ncbi:MAG: hypothetical protein ACYC61_14605, partial [Isosphaeraceae bacterium]
MLIPESDPPPTRRRDAVVSRSGRQPEMPRRSLLRLGVAGLAGYTLHQSSPAWGNGPDVAVPDDRSLIVRSRRPLNLETSVASLGDRLTPTDQFFIRSHFGAPAVD